MPPFGCMAVKTCVIFIAESSPAKGLRAAPDKTGKAH
jgi:hypothetical protein